MGIDTVVRVQGVGYNATTIKDLYKIGDTVPETGLYVCVPCGYTQQFIAGEAFVTCEACLAGTEYGPVGYEDPASEFWQLVG